MFSFWNAISSGDYDKVVEHLKHDPSLIHNQNPHIGCHIDNRPELIRNLYGPTALHGAIYYCSLLDKKEERYKIFDLILSKTKNINEVSSNTLTPLHIAAMLGDIDILKKILNHPTQKCQIDALSGNNETPLMYALLYNKVEVAKLLINHNADIRAVSEGNTVLHYAALHSSTKEICRDLIYQGVKLSNLNNNGETVIDYASKRNVEKDSLRMELEEYEKTYSEFRTAIMNNNANLVLQKIKEKNAVLESVFLKKYMGNQLYYLDPFCLAVVFNAKDTLDILLSANVKTHPKATSLLNIATLNDSQTMMEYLLAKGWKLDGKDIYGLSPLHFALKNGSNNHRVNYLLQLGANPNQTSDDGKTAAHYTALSCDIATLDILIRAKTQFNVLDMEGNNPLHIAASNPKTSSQYILQLIQQGVSITHSNNKGLTPIHLAMMNGNIDIVKTLLEKNSTDISSDDNQYGTLFHYAVQYNMPADILILLKQGRIDINKSNKDGLTPFHLAASIHDLQMMKNLVTLGADSNKKNLINNNNALHYAVINRAPDETLTFLMKDCGLQPNLKNDKDETPLHLIGDNVAAANTLLAAGADVNKPDIYGRSPFYLAANKGIIELMKLYISKSQKPIQLLNPNKFKYFNSKQSDNIIMLVEQGRALMKARQYGQAYEVFDNLLSEPSLIDRNEIYKKIIYWRDKCRDLSQNAKHPYMFKWNSDLDSIAMIMSRVRYSNVVNVSHLEPELRKVGNNIYVKPFLQFTALNFVLNKRATVRVRPFCNTRDNETDSLGVTTYSTIQIKERQSDSESTGTLLHELSHYYFLLAYKNAYNPYNDEANMKSYKHAIKNTLLNMAKYMAQYHKITFDMTMLSTLSTWELGTYIANVYTPEIANDMYVKNKTINTIFSTFLLVYTQHSPVSEHCEFVVRLLQLIGEGYKSEQLEEILMPLMNFYENILIPDCEKLNAEYMHIVDGIYPQPYIPPRHEPLAISVPLRSLTNNNINIISWDVEELRDDSAYVETTINRNKRYIEITSRLIQAIDDKNIDFITLQGISQDSSLMSDIKEALGDKWDFCFNEDMDAITFYNKHVFKLVDNKFVDGSSLLRSSTTFESIESGEKICIMNSLVCNEIIPFEVETEILTSFENISVPTVMIGDINSPYFPRLQYFDEEGKLNYDMSLGAACYYKESPDMKIVELEGIYLTKKNKNRLVAEHNDEAKTIYDYRIIASVDSNAHKEKAVCNDLSLANIEEQFVNMLNEKQVNVRLARDINNNEFIAVITNRKHELLIQYLIEIESSDGVLRKIYMIPKKDPIFEQLTASHLKKNV